jgi:hypothetical protein
LYDITDQRCLKMMRNEEDLIFSLCDSQEILNTYLNVEPVERLHKNSIFYDSKEDLIEVKLVISEMVHNRKSSGMSDSFQGTIEHVPSFLDWKAKFGRFKCGVIIGPWYLEFTDTSICVPKRINKAMNQIFQKIPRFTNIKNNLSEISKVLASIVVDWNVHYTYRGWQPNVKSKEGNCYSFLEQIFLAFKISLVFKGSMYTFMSELKDFGDAGASIFPTDYLNVFESKFGFSYIQDIESHEILDDYISKIMDVEPNFEYEFPDDYLLFQAIDIAFWVRSLKSNDEIYKPLVLDNKTCCPCYESKDFSLIRGTVYRPPNTLRRRSFDTSHKEPRNRNSNVVFSRDPIFDWGEDEPSEEDIQAPSSLGSSRKGSDKEDDSNLKFRTRSVVLNQLGEKLKDAKKNSKSSKSPKTIITISTHTITPMEKLRLLGKKK